MSGLIFICTYVLDIFSNFNYAIQNYIVLYSVENVFLVSCVLRNHLKH